jgi:GNAT superfamily N-acetyltransferase
MAILDDPAGDTEDFRGVLALAKQRTGTCEHPSFIGVCEAWMPENWLDVVAQEGLALALKITGMEAARLLPSRRPAPNLELRRVEDQATARDLAMINAQAYGLPAEMFECICNLDLWTPDSYGYVGYTNGRGVTAAGAFPVDGTIYVALVATLPDEHGKGYAEAVMRRAVESGQQTMGTNRVTLHATEMGQPLYQAMGFEAGAKIALLASVTAEHSQAG